jgi:hypothetical protein
MHLGKFLNSFTDELTKIASFGPGAAVGGAIGLASGGGSLKSRAIRGAAGALVGGGVTAAAGGAKKFLGPDERQHAAAQMPAWEPAGYVPSWAGGPPR